MKNTLRIKMIFILFFIACFSSLYAETGAGVTSLNFLKVAQGGRQTGMGEAFTGVADDVNALTWNPAGLVQLKRQQICLMHSAWLLGVSFEYVAYALPINNVGTFGIYGTFLNSGTIQITSEDAFGKYLTTNEKADASSFNVALAYAKSLGDFLAPDNPFSDLSFGILMSSVSEKIFEDSGSGFAFGFSTYYFPKYENISYGLNLQNVGFTSNRPTLPLTVRFGMGYRFALENIFLSFMEEGYYKFAPLDSIADFDLIYYPVEGFARVNMGVEKCWQLNKIHAVVLRVGYKFGYDLGMVSGITCGLGYRLSAGKDTAFELDYALVPYGELGVSHRISLTGKFFGDVENHFYEDINEAKKYYVKGYEAISTREYSKALEFFRGAIKRYKKFPMAYVGVGACFLNLGKNTLAVEAYEKALEYNPTDEKLRNFINTQKSYLQSTEPASWINKGK